MASLYNRIIKRILSTVDAFRKDCVFSVKLAVYRMIDDLSWRIHMKKLSGVFREKKDRWIMDYLKHNLQPVLEKYKVDSTCGEYQPNAPIWICWWTGEDSAPELVQQCIRSIKAQAGSHPVHMITQETYNQYLQIPEYMLEKVVSGKMGLAHLADYIRVALLAQCGGLWLDVTIYCACQIPDTYFENAFFTCKSEPQSSRYLSQMQWTTFVLGGWRGNVFFRFLQSAFEAYWQREDAAIDYLFFDYLIELARREIPAVRHLLSAVPVNNLRRDDLQAAMNRAANPDEWKLIVQPDTVLYKLSWRESYSTTTRDGKESIYKYFLRKEV